MRRTARNSEETGGEASVWVTLSCVPAARGATCTKIICDSGDSGKLPHPERAGKYVAITSFTNEYKIVVMEAPVRNEGHVDLRRKLDVEFDF